MVRRPITLRCRWAIPSSAVEDNLQSAPTCDNRRVTPPAPTAAEIETAARLIRAGCLVAFPTETVYGLGANALDAEAVAKIYKAKGRPSTSPLIVHVASIEMAKSLVTEWPEVADRLAHRFWPGPLTLVLKARVPSRRSSPVEHGATAIPDIVTAGLSTVGVRMPAHPIAIALIRAAGVPLAAPSANRFTELSPTTADHVRRGLGADVEFILDGGPCAVGIESTVLSLVGPQPVLLRPGAVSRAEIESLIGRVDTAADIATGAHPAPGMHPRHYSPRTRLAVVRNGDVPLSGQGTYLQLQHPSRRSDIAVVAMPLTAAEYAATLYDQLHQADSARLDWIAIDNPPETPDWEAVHDRLRRASS